MTDIALPSGLQPASVTWTLDRNRGLASSFNNRTVQEQGRPGDCWLATAQWTTLQDDRAYALAAWLDQVSKVGNYAIVPAVQNDMSGTEMEQPEFADLNGPWRTNGFSGWAGSGLIAGPMLDGPYAAFVGGNTPPSYISRSFSVVQGLPYNLVLDVPNRRGAPFRFTLFDGTGSLIDVGGSAGSTDYGRQAFTVFPRSSSITAFLYSSNDSDAFRKGIYGDLKIYRALIAQGTTSAGAELKGMQGGIAGASARTLKRGQFFTVKTSRGYELKRCENSLSLIGGGNINGVAVTHAGGVEFAPATRGVIADQSGIHHIQPWCRMRLVKRSSASDISPPLLHGFAVDFIEQLN